MVQAGETEIRCPNCGKWFCGLTPAGHASGRFRCNDGCKLEFIIEHPLPPLISLHAATALLHDRWQYSMEQARRLLDPLTECVTPEGKPLLLWEKVKALSPVRKPAETAALRPSARLVLSTDRKPY